MRIVAEQHSSEFDSLENCAIQVPVEDTIRFSTVSSGRAANCTSFEIGTVARIAPFS
jgi:hypothetical protein